MIYCNCGSTVKVRYFRLVGRQRVGIKIFCNGCRSRYVRFGKGWL
jgi:hypothetical protein